MLKKIVSFLILLIPACLTAVPDARLPDDSLLDPAYPDMREWARAGVIAAEVPDRPRTTLRLQEGDDLAAAVAVPDRLVLLGPGRYPVSKTLRLADNVTLRGHNSQHTTLVLTLRGEPPSGPDDKGHIPWTSGLLLEGVTGSGVENLTVRFDDSLPPPPDPRAGGPSYTDNPNGQTDLHVVSVRLSGSRHCWLSNVSLRNSGQHPLVIESSSHITVDSVEIEGVYNKGDRSGNLLISGSEYCLLSGLHVSAINHVSFTNDSAERPSRYNVLVNSRIAVDVRFRNPEARSNLIQECVIEVPAWHDFPPISLGWNLSRAPGATTSNLIYFCTITRDFPSSRSRFSIADNPNMVYHILANSTLKGNVEIAGPAPKFSTLWPVR